MAGYTKIPWGRSELDFVGGLRGQPLAVVNGQVTGLPIRSVLRSPSRANSAVEEDGQAEGPFGEWPGYYSAALSGTGRPQPVIRVKALYFRDQPIILNQAPLWPGAVKHAIPITAGMLWDQLDAAGIQDIAGVYSFTSYLDVVAIRHAMPATPSRSAMPCWPARRRPTTGATSWWWTRTST